ncbi:MAG: TonB-dependent receptor [Hyphomonadaceae bacterium]
MSKGNLLATSALFALGLTVPAQAHAQESDSSKTEPKREIIVVTAQKQEQDIIDVPINIAVADQAKLDLLGTDDIEEFADFVPGLQVQAQSLNASSYSMRGVTSDGGRPRVAVFENGVAIGNPRFGANTAMFDLERIEVVKGPQATLFGQGALVGGINFLQAKASLDGNEGWLKLDGGDYSYVRAEAGYNFAVSDTFAVRLAGLIKNRDGYVPNVSNSPDLMGQDTTALRAVFAWEPSDTVRADLFLNYQEDDSTGTQFKSGVFPPPGGDLSPYSATANNVTPYQLRPKLGADRELFSATLNLAWELSDAWTLTSITNERSMSDLEAFDSDGADFSLLQFASVDNAQTWSQELRMNYDAGGPISAFFGANYYTQDHSVLLRFHTDEARAQALLASQIAAGAGMTVDQLKGVLSYYGVPNATNLDNVLDPLPISVLMFLTQGAMVPLSDSHVEENFANGEQKSTDFFGDVTWRATDRLSLTAGLRYTKDEISSDVIYYLVHGNPALGGTRNAVTGGTTLVATDSNGVPDARSYDADGELTWRFNAAYRVNDDLNTWFAIGRGRRPPSLSSRKCSTNPANSGYSPTCDATIEATGFEVVDQEIYDNVEIGMSGVFLDDRLRMTASTYYGEYKDFQTSRYDVSQGSFITENSGNATTYGVELDGSFRAADFVDLYGGYAYTFAEYDDTDDNGNTLAYAGNKFRLSPEHSYSVAADFHWPVANGVVSFVPTYIWKGDQYFEDDNQPNEFQEAYGLLDLKVTWDAESGRWGASAYLDNATDEEYLIDAGNTGGEFGIPTYIRGVPRMFGAGVWVKF